MRRESWLLAFSSTDHMLSVQRIGVSGARKTQVLLTRKQLFRLVDFQKCLHSASQHDWENRKGKKAPHADLPGTDDLLQVIDLSVEPPDGVLTGMDLSQRHLV